MTKVLIPFEWTPLIQFGLQNVNFLQVLDTFKDSSQKSYIRAIAEYLQFVVDHPQTLLVESLVPSNDNEARISQAIEFLKFKRACGLTGNTLQTKWSQVMLFFNTVYSIDLNKSATLGQRLLNQYKKQDPDPTQAAVFTLEQLLTFYSFPLAKHTAHIAVYAIMTTHGAERGIESKRLTFEDVTKLVNPITGEIQYQVQFDRQKLLGDVTNKRGVTFLVTAPEAVAIVNRYIEMTPISVRSGRFYRYNEWNCRTNEWYITAKPVGDCSLSQCAKHIATALKLPNASTFSGKNISLLVISQIFMHL